MFNLKWRITYKRVVCIDFGPKKSYVPQGWQGYLLYVLETIFVNFIDICLFTREFRKNCHIRRKLLARDKNQVSFQSENKEHVLIDVGSLPFKYLLFIDWICWNWSWLKPIQSWICIPFALSFARFSLLLDVSPLWAIDCQWWLLQWPSSLEWIAQGSPEEKSWHTSLSCPRLPNIVDLSESPGLTCRGASEFDHIAPLSVNNSL